MRTLAFLILALSSAVASAQNPWGLSEDFNKWYLTAVYSDNMDANDSALYHALRNELNDVRKTTVFNEYQSSNETIRDTAWQQHLGIQRPCLLLQGLPSADGGAEVIFYQNGIEAKDLGGIRDALFRSVRDRTAAANGESYVFQRCPGGTCPFPRRPAPAPQPPTIIPIYPTVPPAQPPATPPPVEPLAPTVPAAPANEGRPLWHYLLPLLATGGSLYLSQKREEEE